MLIFSWPADGWQACKLCKMIEILSVLLPGHAYYRYLILKDKKGMLLMSISTGRWDLLFCLWWIDGPCWELSEENLVSYHNLKLYLVRIYILASKPTGTKSSNFLNTIELNVHLKVTLINLVQVGARSFIFLSKKTKW